MPFVGLSLLLQILCAVHVMKTGRPYYWIFIVMFAPMVGMIAYFIVEILPELTGSRTTGLGWVPLMPIFWPSALIMNSVEPKSPSSF